MEIIIGILKICITAICAFLFFNNTQDIKIRKLNTKWIIETVEESKIFKNKVFRQMKLNCYKLGIDFRGIEIVIFIFGVIVSIILFGILKLIFKINSVAVILAIPFVFSGFLVVQYLADKKQDKLEEVMNDFFIQFRGEIKVNNDIISAFRKIQNTCLPPFNEYIGKMMVEIKAGEIPEESLKRFADKVDINKFHLYINNLKYCNTYGGNVEALTIETQKMIDELLKQKKKRKKETNSICTALYMLIAIDLLIYFSFIINNPMYLKLMTNSGLGNSIININFISIWIVALLSYFVKRLDM
jgi:Flp pilus assembly protein TadB